MSEEITKTGLRVSALGIKPSSKEITPMTEELKPCPFCGHDDIAVDLLGGRTRVWCHESCYASVTDIDTDRAIETWNTRSPAWRDEAVERIRELTDELRRNAPGQIVGQLNLSAIADHLEAALPLPPEESNE